MALILFTDCHVLDQLKAEKEKERVAAERRFHVLRVITSASIGHGPSGEMELPGVYVPQLDVLP